MMTMMMMMMMMMMIDDNDLFVCLFRFIHTVVYTCGNRGALKSDDSDDSDDDVDDGDDDGDDDDDDDDPWKVSTISKHSLTADATEQNIHKTLNRGSDRLKNIPWWWWWQWWWWWRWCWWQSIYWTPNTGSDRLKNISLRKRSANHTADKCIGYHNDDAKYIIVQKAKTVCQLWQTFWNNGFPKSREDYMHHHHHQQGQLWQTFRIFF